MFKNNKVEQKISKKTAKRRCTNENCQKIFENIKRKCDLCKSKVKKTATLN